MGLERVRGAALAIVILTMLSLLMAGTPNAAASSYRNEATIVLTPQQYVSIAGLALGDTDGDGASEIVATYDWYFGSGTPRLVFYQWTGSAYSLEAGVDGVKVAPGSGGLGATPRRIPLVDLNLDGRLEVLIAGSVQGTDGLYLFRWNGTGYAVLGSMTGTFGDAVVGDGDSDGIAEVFVTTTSSVNAYEWASDHFVLEDTFTPSSPFYRLAVGDADNDTVPEVVVSTNYLDVASYTKGASGYALEGSGSVAYGYVDRDMFLADTDGDGQREVVRLDFWLNVVVYGWSVNKFVVEWNGSGLPSEGWGSTSLAFGDTDDDGAVEFLVANDARVGSPSMAVFEYAGGNYTIDWYSGYLDGYVNVAVIGDADGDGTTEIVAGSEAWSTIWLFSLNLGDQPPVAVAQADRTTSYMGEDITFSGLGSTDDVGIQSYAWNFGDGLSTLGVQVLHRYSVRGFYVVILTVTDTSGQQSSDTVDVSVVNRVPTANAGPDFSAAKHVVFALNASGSSDADGDPLTFVWARRSGPAISLTDATSVIAHANASVCGVYEFEVQVSDGLGGVATDRVSVSIPNHAPVADAGEDRTVNKRTSVTLNASGSSDPDGDPITFLWEQVAGPQVSLQGQSAATSTFVPQVRGLYTFRVTVTDAEAAQAVDTVNLTVLDRPPIVELALPTGTIVLRPGDSQDFRVTASDPDGDALAYTWRVDGVETGSGAAAFTFTATGLGTHRINVSISDGTNMVWQEWTLNVQGPASEAAWPVWTVAGVVAACAATAAVVLLLRRRRQRRGA